MIEISEPGSAQTPKPQTTWAEFGNALSAAEGTSECCNTSRELSASGKPPSKPKGSSQYPCHSLILLVGYRGEPKVNLFHNTRII